MGFNNMIEAIKSMKTPLLIGISGYGGSGKSTLAKKLSIELNAPIVGVDSFCKTTDDIAYKLWNIMDYKRLEFEVLKPYTLGEPIIKYGVFNWEHNCVLEHETINNGPYLIVEGVGLFRPELQKYFSYSIWIDCPIEVATKRGMKRDRDEYGVDNDIKWLGIWKDNDLECYRIHSPNEKADYIISCN